MSERDQLQPYNAYPVGGDYYAAPPSAAPRIGDWLSESFNLFGKEWQTWVGQGLIFVVLVYGPMLLGYFSFYGVMIAAGISTPSGSSGSSQPPSWMMGSMVTTLVLMLLGVFGGTILALWLSAGMKRTAAKQLRGEPIRVGDIWSGGDVVIPMIGLGIMMSLASFAGMFLFCIGAYLAMALLFFSSALVVEERMGVMDAMRRSWAVVRPHMWMYLLWVFVIGMIGGVGAQFCLIGAAVTLPIYFIATMVSYRDAIGLPGALPPMLNKPQPAAPVQGASYTYGPAGAPMAGAPCPNCGRALAVGAVICPACQTHVPYGYTGIPATPVSVDPPGGGEGPGA